MAGISAHFVTQRCRETIICKLQGKSFYFLSLLIEKLHKVRVSLLKLTSKEAYMYVNTSRF